MPIDTGRDSQGLITGAAVQAIIHPRRTRHQQEVGRRGAYQRCCAQGGEGCPQAGSHDGGREGGAGRVDPNPDHCRVRSRPLKPNSTRQPCCSHDSIATAVRYAEEPAGPKFQNDGIAFRAWRSLWGYAHEKLALLLAGGREQSTVEAFLLELLALELPA